MLFFASCKTEHTTETSYKGALKNMMYKEDVSAKANLADFKNTNFII